MPLRNTPAAYGTVARTFHWVMAVLILVSPALLKLLRRRQAAAA